MIKKDISILIAKKWLKSIAATELERLDKWINLSAENERSYQIVWTALNNKPLPKNSNEDEMLSLIAKLWKRQATADKNIFKLNKPKNRDWLRIAIILCIVLSTSILAIRYAYNARQQQSMNLTTNAQVQVGTDKATLTMDNGSTMQLDGKSITIFSKDGKYIAKDASGKVLYTTDQLSTPIYNTVTVPRGGKYQLHLSDGTKVWLNSASSIRYPVIFNGDERKVSITGEVYFEVASKKIKQSTGNSYKKKPFTVDIGGKGIVEVLGTHFNIDAYQNDGVLIKTTLLEGSVKFITSDKEQFIQPGEQVQLNQSGNLFIQHNVDVDKIIAWKENMFKFKNDDLFSIMHQLERWYDVNTIYTNVNDRLTYSGSIRRDAPLEDVLNMLHLAGVEYIIEGKTVRISNK